MDNLSKPVKILIGLLTIWPPIWMVMFVISLIGNGVIAVVEQPGREFLDGLRFFAIMIPHMLTVFLMSGLMIFYIVHVIMTTRIAENKTKALWAALLYLFNMLAMIVYWFMYIWPEPKVAAGEAEQTSG